jgi:hypothetical protein
MAGAVVAGLCGFDSALPPAMSAPGGEPPAVDDAVAAVSSGALGPDARLRWVGWESAGTTGGYVVLHVDGISRWADLGAVEPTWAQGDLTGLARTVAELFTTMGLS